MTCSFSVDAGNCGVQSHKPWHNGSPLTQSGELQTTFILQVKPKIVKRLDQLVHRTGSHTEPARARYNLITFL